MCSDLLELHCTVHAGAAPLSSSQRLAESVQTTVEAPAYDSGGGTLCFRLVNACYRPCAMIMMGNRGFGELAEILGDAVVATALLDRFCITQWSSRSKGTRAACASRPRRSRSICAGARC